MNGSQGMKSSTCLCNRDQLGCRELSLLKMWSATCCKSLTNHDPCACIPGCSAMTPLQPLSMKCWGHCPQLQTLETCSKARYERASTDQSVCDLQQHRSMPDGTSGSACTLLQPLLQKNALVSKGFQQSLTLICLDLSAWI